MNEMFSTTKQKILFIINTILILLYFILDIASIALFVTPEFNVLWKFIAIIFPWIIIYFTAPRTNGGYKFTVSIWGTILIFYYIYNGNVQIKGNQYIHTLMGGDLIVDELRINMIIAIVLSCFVFISGLGILYRMKEKDKCNEGNSSVNVPEKEEKPVEYIYYDENGNISETPTTHKVRK